MLPQFKPTFVFFPHSLTTLDFIAWLATAICFNPFAFTSEDFPEFTDQRSEIRDHSLPTTTPQIPSRPTCQDHNSPSHPSSFSSPSSLHSLPPPPPLSASSSRANNKSTHGAATTIPEPQTFQPLAPTQPIDLLTLTHRPRVVIPLEPPSIQP